jgi:tetratricopeptide (TPR) repeat protein
MRISEASGDTVLATRALRLYVHTVGKAKLARKSTESDATWVSTLVWGARMLCRLAHAADSTVGHRGIDEAREAGVILEKARERLDPSDKTLKARAELAEGIWNTVMAIKGTYRPLITPMTLLISNAEQDHLSRSARLTNALSLFESSIQDHPSASAYFHLALALYRPIPARDLGRAIEHARSAVELEPDNIRYWHLLGLLLIASEDWRGAGEVLEAGAALDDQAWMAEQTPSLAGDIADSSTIGKETDSTTGVTATDYASVDHPEKPSAVSEKASTVTERPVEQQAILDSHSHTLPPLAELLQPLPDHPRPSDTDRFEHGLQLRMTQLALTELMEGPEGTEEKWIEVFQWFAKRKGPERDSSRELHYACGAMLRCVLMRAVHRAHVDRNRSAVARSEI